MGTRILVSAGFVTLAATLALAGCYGGLESQPYFDANTRWMAKGPRVIVGPDIEIIVKVSNSQTRFSRNTGPDYFGLSFYFDPKRPGFSFDPEETVLDLKGKKSPPSRIAKVFAGDNFRSTEWRCGIYPYHDFGAGPSYNLFRGACFEFYFNVPAPSPETMFTVELAGLRLDGKSVYVPPIHFRKGSFRVFDFLGK